MQAASDSSFTHEMCARLHTKIKKKEGTYEACYTFMSKNCPQRLSIIPYVLTIHQ